MTSTRASAPGHRRMRLACAALLVTALGAVCVAAGTGACDTENTCAMICPTGSRFTNDGTCACLPFDAGYCGLARDCPDAYCPASSVPDACGGGQLWSTAICGCYPLVDARQASPDSADARADVDADR